jgi:hypothetical protein
MIAEMYGNMFGSRRILSMCRENVERIKKSNDFSMMLVHKIHDLLRKSMSFWLLQRPFTPGTPSLDWKDSDSVQEVTDT